MVYSHQWKETRLSLFLKTENGISSVQHMVSVGYAREEAPGLCPNDTNSLGFFCTLDFSLKNDLYSRVII